MKTLHKKRTMLLTFLTVCAAIAIGLFCALNPFHAKASISTLTVTLGSELSGTADRTDIELYSETALKEGDILMCESELAEVRELPEEEGGYYILSCETGGEFFARQNQEERVTLNPSLDTARFKIQPAAYLRSTDLYRLRYSIYIPETSIESDSILTVGFAADYGAGCKLSFDSEKISGRQATKDVSGYSFRNGFTTVYVYVSAPLYQELQLTATIGGERIRSGTDSIFTVWSRIIENNFNTLMSKDSVENYIRKTVAFSVGGDTFGIGNAAQLSSETGFLLLVNIPEEYMTLLKSGETTISETTHYRGGAIGTGGVPFYTEGSYCDYYFVISRSSDVDSFGNTMYGGESVTDYYYSFNASERHISGTNELSGMLNNTTVGQFYIPIPTDVQTDYIYYAKIVKSTYNRIKYYFPSKISDYEGERTITAYTTNYYQKSVRSLAEEILNRGASLTEGEREWLQDTAGIKPSTTEIPVTVKYKELTDYATVRERSYTFKVKSVYAQNTTLIVSALYDLTEYGNIADFNAVYTGDYWCDGYRYTTQERIILQARDFEYSYNPTTEKGTLEVVYGDFQYKDLLLRITNNDPENNLTIDYYTSNVKVGGTSTTLTFRFADIEEQLHNSCNWLFDFGKENIRISGKPEGMTVELTDEALTVTFPNAKESELINLSLIGVAEIIEDVEYTLTYEYAELSLNGTEIVETIKTSAPIVKLYSEIVTCNYTNFMLDYGELVNAAVNPEFLGGAEYYVPVSIRKEYSAYDSETHTCKITVEYTYNTLFGITNNYDDGIIFKALNHSSLMYTGEYFVADIPDGWRVEGVSTSAEYRDKLRITNAEDYRASKIEVRTSTTAKEILPIVVNFTDHWNVTVNYLEDYIDYGMKTGEKDNHGEPVRACFAEKKQFLGTVKIRDIADIYHPTDAELIKILGIKKLDILGLATVADTAVTFDGVSEYTMNLSYSFAALKQMDYNGNQKEIKVPLTSYADWCEEYGKDWSILFLNKTDRHYFKYSNDVKRENLYGFFSVAVFKEQVSDLNFYFQKNTGAGCMSIFSSGKIQGSGLYKFFGRLATKGGFIGPLLGVPLISTMCMNLCELIDDDNAIYYSYFFYLDGTSENPYLALNGATNADDTDSAIKNTLEDIKAWIEKVGDSEALKRLKIVFGVLLIVAVVVAAAAGGYKLLTWSGLIKPTRKTATPKKKTPAVRKKSGRKKKSTRTKK